MISVRESDVLPLQKESSYPHLSFGLALERYYTLKSTAGLFLSEFSLPIGQRNIYSVVLWKTIPV